MEGKKGGDRREGGRKGSREEGEGGLLTNFPIQ